jgi:hypothetical protein
MVSKFVPAPMIGHLVPCQDPLVMCGAGEGDIPMYLSE